MKEFFFSASLNQVPDDFIYNELFNFIDVLPPGP